jgi:hypothetical protein
VAAGVGLTVNGSGLLDVLVDDLQTLGKQFTIDGGTFLIQTGNHDLMFIDRKARISGWILAADQSGDVFVEVQKSTPATFPTFAKISGTAPMALSGQRFLAVDSSMVADWTKDLDAGDMLRFVVSSPSAITLLHIFIRWTNR